MRKVLFLLTLCLAFSVSAMAQFTVTGTVTDSAGLGIHRVSILEKGTTNGTITNADGNYTLRLASPDAKLVFSFVGMKSQKIAVKGSPVVNASLKTNVIDLGEVVVTASGVTKKARNVRPLELEFQWQNMPKGYTIVVPTHLRRHSCEDGQFWASYSEL